jgi:hypothetical protein
MDRQAQEHGIGGAADLHGGQGDATRDSMVNVVERDLSREPVGQGDPPVELMNRVEPSLTRLDWIDPEALETLKRRRQRDATAAREGMQMPGWATPLQASDVHADAQRSADTALPDVRQTAGEAAPKPQGNPSTPASTPTNDPLVTPPESVSKRYLQAGHRYFLRDGSREIAFEDRGPRMVTAHNRPDIAESMAEMALAKGWMHIRAKGHEDFRRSVWLAASVRGIGVTGYVPNEIDRAALADLIQSRMTNRVESVTLPAADAGANSQQPISARTVESDRELSGQLIQHGAAPYRHEPHGTRSYFVTLRGADGADKTVWGVDLERAIEASGAQSGQTVALSNLGRQPVTIQEPVHDAAGQVIGEQPKLVERNVWQVRRVGPEQAPLDLPAPAFAPVATQPSLLEQPTPAASSEVCAAAPDINASSPESEFRGELVSHGRAPYQNRIGAQTAYFATLRESDGHQVTVWGADLERAIVAGGAQAGDQVHLANYGRRRIDAEVPVTDGQGKVTGAERRTIERYAWSATVEPREQKRDDSAEHDDSQHALHMSVIAEAMRAQGFSDKSVEKVQARASTVLDRLKEQGVAVPAPRVFDPAGRSQQPRSRGNPAVPVVAPEVERMLQPTAPGVPSR